MMTNECNKCDTVKYVPESAQIKLFKLEREQFQGAIISVRIVQRIYLKNISTDRHEYNYK